MEELYAACIRSLDEAVSKTLFGRQIQYVFGGACKNTTSGGTRYFYGITYKDQPPSLVPNVDNAKRRTEPVAPTNHKEEAKIRIRAW